jgi:hypothetical protein
MLLRLYFMPPDQIAHMSLNGLRMRVATRDKTQTRTWIHEPGVSFDLEHRVSFSDTPPLSFCRPKKCFLEYLRH